MAEEMAVRQGRYPLDVSSYLASQNICRRMNAVYWNQIDEGNLIKCQLGNTGITSLRKGDFQGLDNLPSPYGIYLRNNDLSSLPEGIFQGLNNLETLGLHENNLDNPSSLVEKIFHGLNNLRYLSLSRNNLSSLPEDIFQDLNNLQTLWLYDNNLTCLPSLPNSLKEIRLGHLNISIIRTTINLPPCKPSKPFDETELTMGLLDSAPYAAMGSSPPRASSP